MSASSTKPTPTTPTPKRTSGRVTFSIPIDSSRTPELTISTTPQNTRKVSTRHTSGINGSSSDWKDTRSLVLSPPTVRIKVKTTDKNESSDSKDATVGSYSTSSMPSSTTRRRPGRPRKASPPSTPQPISTTDSLLGKRRRSAQDQKSGSTSVARSDPTQNSPGRKKLKRSLPVNKPSDEIASVDKRELSSLEKLRLKAMQEKENDLVKVVERHEALVRELFFMESRNAAMTDLDPQKLKLENNEHVMK
ncbi:7670_t:CDS:1, partial [Paraglomus occultum]